MDTYKMHYSFNKFYLLLFIILLSITPAWAAQEPPITPASAAQEVQSGIITTVELKFQHSGDFAPFAIFGWSHDIVTAYGEGSGIPTGKRQHKPLLIKKLLNQLSPVLYNAIINNETLDVTIRTFNQNKNGKLTPAFTIVLTEARVISVNTHQDGDITSDEIVGFIYKTISWTDEASGMTAQDDWGRVDM